MIERIKNLLGWSSFHPDIAKNPPKMYGIRYHSESYSEFKSKDFRGKEILSFNETLELVKKQKITWNANKGKIGDLHRFGFYHSGYSKRFIDLLKANGITNFTSYKLKINESKDCPGYYYLDVHCKPIQKIEKERRGLIMLDICSFFDLNDWGGEDLFKVIGINCHLCTEKVKNIVEENKLTNFRFDEIPRVGSPKKQSKEYTLVLTKENLEIIDDEELPQFLATYVIDCEIKKDWNREYEIVMSLPLPLRVNYVTYMLEGEVHNGGYGQYFFNSPGQYAFEAVEYLKLIGAKKLAETTQKALDTITGSSLSKEKYLKNQRNRELIPDARKIVLAKAKRELNESELEWGVLNEYESKLEKYDNQFYNNDENLWWLRIEYLKKHLDEIISS